MAGCKSIVVALMVALFANALGAPPSADKLTAPPALLTPPELALPSKPNANACQRRPLIVNFADLGWNDWIVAPDDYDAGYCSGECLPNTLPNATNHAIVQSLVNNLQDTVPKPCCVPTELEPISAIYVSERNMIVLRNYQDMKVKSCGCR